jgi:hypothetical protein
MKSTIQGLTLPSTVREFWGEKRLTTTCSRPPSARVCARQEAASAIIELVAVPTPAAADAVAVGPPITAVSLEAEHYDSLVRTAGLY